MVLMFYLNISLKIGQMIREASCVITNPHSPSKLFRRSVGPRYRKYRADKTDSIAVKNRPELSVNGPVCPPERLVEKKKDAFVQV